MIVIDSSALVDALLIESCSEKFANLLNQQKLVAPDHIDVEVLHSLRKIERLDQITSATANGAVNVLRNLPIHRLSVREWTDNIWQLRHNITPYDAAYVVLCKALDAKLLTHDQKLISSSAKYVELIQHV